MKIYTIATESRECYGHGDFGTELRIVRQGGYGSGDFPPCFTHQHEALLWRDAQQFKTGVLVELELL